MLLTTTDLPTNTGGIPWGTIILAVIIIGGVGYVTYHAVQPPKTIKNPNSDL